MSWWFTLTFSKQQTRKFSKGLLGKPMTWFKPCFISPFKENALTYRRNSRSKYHVIYYTSMRDMNPQKCHFKVIEGQIASTLAQQLISIPLIWPSIYHIARSCRVMPNMIPSWLNIILRDLSNPFQLLQLHWFCTETSY